MRPSRAQLAHLNAALEGGGGPESARLKDADARARQAAWVRDCMAGGKDGRVPGMLLCCTLIGPDLPSMSTERSDMPSSLIDWPIGVNAMAGMFQFLMGPALAGAHVHAHGAAWNVLVHGRKRWFLFPPHTPPLFAAVLRAGGLLEPQFGRPALEWFRTEYPILRSSPIAPLEVIQEPGDIVWVPERWGHAVLNLEPSVGFAMEIGFSRS